MNNVAHIGHNNPPQGIAVYDEFRAQLAQLEDSNAKLVFDYEDPKGNKEARSHVYKLRQTKAAVEKARKEEKAASLEYGRKVDAEAKEIMGKVEAMIDVHQKPLDEIEQREKDRVAKIQNRIEWFHTRRECSGYGSQELQNSIAAIKAVAIDESFAEFQLDAAKAKEAALAAHEAELPIAQKREAEQAELERLRRETAEREQQEREERLQREAAERATREAEEKAHREKEEMEAKAKQEREAAERRELELKLAAERAEKEKAQAVENERRRAEEERQKLAEEEAKREADRQHQAKIHGDIITALGKSGISDDQGKVLITAIRKGEIPHIKIIY